jgi:hypothetical protein
MHTLDNKKNAATFWNFYIFWGGSDAAVVEELNQIIKATCPSKQKTKKKKIEEEKNRNNEKERARETRQLSQLTFQSQFSYPSRISCIVPPIFLCVLF